MLNAIRIPRTTPWLPPPLRRIPGEIHHAFRFSEPERKIFRKRKRIPVSAWAERYRVVTTSVLPGRWKNEVTPYLAGIMNASFFPSVRTVIICKAPQVGGTEAVLNCIGYAIDRDPGPVLFVYPDEKTAKENNQDRLQPMIKGSPRLRGYMTGISDDSSMFRIALQHMPIYMAWARSAARLANKPIRYLVFDEVDKYVDTAGKRETDPISLGEARAITYRYNCKYWKISTPTTDAGNIWKALTTEAQVIFDFWVSCPACGVLQKMCFAQIKWAHKDEAGPDGKKHSEDPEAIEAENLTRYECPYCLALWNDYERDIAVRRGRWRERKKNVASSEEIKADEPGLDMGEYLQRFRPAKIGFHLPSWLSPFISLSKIAAAFLRGLSDVNKFKDFHNKFLAEPWRLTVICKNNEQILAARCDLPAQTVPQRAIALTAGIDVQMHGFWFVVRAWAPDLTSWLIHYGFLATWDEVERLLFETSYPAAGDPDRSYRIFRACVDTGGSRKYEDMTMTEETYFWLIANRGRRGVALWGTKGSSTTLPGMLKLGETIISTPAGKKLPEVIRLLVIDTEKAKDQYHYRLNMAAKEETRELPGAAFLHGATGEDYVAQILAEEKQRDDKDRETWVNVHQRPNHLLDAEILAGACVEMEFPGGGLRLMAEYLRQHEGQSGSRERKNRESDGVARSNWMTKR